MPPKRQPIIMLAVGNSRQTRSQSQTAQDQRPDNIEDVNEEADHHNENEEADRRDVNEEADHRDVNEEANHHNINEQDSDEEVIIESEIFPAAGELFRAAFHTSPQSGGDGGSTSTSSTQISVIDILDEESDSDEPVAVGLHASTIESTGAHRGGGGSSRAQAETAILLASSSAADTATPPRMPNILDETVDLTDSPMAAPGSAFSSDTPASVSSAAAVSSTASTSSPTTNSSSPAGTSSASPGPTPLIRCPVCLDDLQRIRSAQKTLMSTVCGHLFCSSCLPICMRESRRCPTCRRFLHARDTHPIFI